MQPLVVDLDGTLIKSDLLYESANTFIVKRPLECLRILIWLIKEGKGGLKTRLAGEGNIDAALLPYNQALITWLREQRMKGRIIVLATASARVLAKAVAERLDLFDDVVGTEGSINLKSEHKRDLLLKRYGLRGFDYVGNDLADIPIFKVARNAFLVSSSQSMIGKVDSLGNLEGVFDPCRRNIFKAWLMALRPHQWVKNVLTFLPLLAAHRFHDASSLLMGLLAFLVFGLTASSVYLLNDLVDVIDDRQHKRKNRRPFAAGDLSLASGWIAWPLLVMMAYAIAWFLLPLLFIAILTIYFALTLAYSLKIKQIVVVDVITLAGLYTLRIIAGAAATNTSPSFWLLVFSMFLFLSLAFIKRFSEIKADAITNQNRQIPGRGYVYTDLEIVSTMGVTAGYIAVLVLAFYVQDPHTAQLYRSPKLIWFACPLLLLWISRVWLISNRGQMHDDPIIFALKDAMSWIIAFCLLVDLVLAQVIR